jgi:uroporphyrin-III C-methyltransferase
VDPVRVNRATGSFILIDEATHHTSRRHDRAAPMGKVWLVGAGPGRPDLLTLRAARLIESADIVFHDALVHHEVLALAHCRRVDVGKRWGKVSTEQRFINRALVEAARTHERVVRLEGRRPDAVRPRPGRARRAGGRGHRGRGGARRDRGARGRRAPSDLAHAPRRSRAPSLSSRPRVGEGESASQWLPSALAADSVALHGGGRRPIDRRGADRRGQAGRYAAALVESATLPGERQLHTTLAKLAAEALPRAEGPW